ncbi:MAG: Panacea domain-containing protein [Methylocella sp.]
MVTDKFKALVHLAVASCDDPQRLGATRLNKICWYSDTIAYRSHGQPITTETYVRRQHGSAPRNALVVLKQLEDEGKIKVRHSDHPIYKTRLFINLEDADTSLFAPYEIEIIQGVAKAICENYTASSISEFSHDCIWEAANEGEIIPLFATLAGQAGEITDEIMTWADSVVERVCEAQPVTP